MRYSSPKECNLFGRAEVVSLRGGEMMKAIAFNGSPRMERGYTSRRLFPLLEGIQSAGCDTELFFTNVFSPRPCSCGNMQCWDIEPGICCIKDSLQPIYQKIKESEIIILAVPVYIPLQGEMQNLNE